MKEAFFQANQLINKTQKVLLTMHERMDGDDGGSILAMAKHLEKEGKTVTCSIKQGVPPNLLFLPGSQKILDDITHENFDLLITFGCSNKKRCGSTKIMELKVPIINFDHHPDNELFGYVNLVDDKKSSVAELVYDFFLHSGWTIDKEIATCLLTGIITDTGGFMHSNTQSSTLKAVAHLVLNGGKINKILNQAFKSKPPNTLQAWGKAIENSYYDKKNNFIYSVFTEKDFKQLDQLPKAAFEGFTEILNTIPEAKFSMFLKQEGDIIKGSLRSEEEKQVDVAKIAKLFGGGGHKLAAGFSITGKLTKNEQGKWNVL